MSYLAFVLDEDSRNTILNAIPPLFSDVICHHVTFKMVKSGFELPDTILSTVEVYGYVCDDSLEALLVRVDGETVREDGGTYHITLSLDRDKGRKPKDSNDVIKNEELCIFEDTFVVTGNLQICN